MDNMFMQNTSTSQAWSNLGGFPFTFNIKNAMDFSAAFMNLGLRECPKIRGSIKWSNSTTFNNMLNENYMTSLDDLFTTEMMEGCSSLKITSQ